MDRRADGRKWRNMASYYRTLKRNKTKRDVDTNSEITTELQNIITE